MGGRRAMWGKPSKETRSPGSTAIAIGVGVVVLVLGTAGVLVWLVPKPEPQTDLDSVTKSAPAIAPSPTLSPSAPPSAAPAPSATAPASPDPATPPTTRQGSLRVSNPTEYPIRLAILVQKPGSASASETTYEAPAHWDFAPGEGAEKGLLLSLPGRNLALKPGDVLVAFAQDGSRRYWGPYVIGETPLPSWEAATTEWQLVLQP